MEIENLKKLKEKENEKLNLLKSILKNDKELTEKEERNIEASIITTKIWISIYEKNIQLIENNKK